MSPYDDEFIWLHHIWVDSNGEYHANLGVWIRDYLTNVPRLEPLSQAHRYLCMLTLGSLEGSYTLIWVHLWIQFSLLTTFLKLNRPKLNTICPYQISWKKFGIKLHQYILNACTWKLNEINGIESMTCWVETSLLARKGFLTLKVQTYFKEHGFRVTYISIVLDHFLFFIFIKRQSGDIKCYRGTPNFNIHPHDG